jgi:chromosome segregation ATPase
MSFSPENILYYAVAAASGYAGALTAFYRQRNKIELLSAKISTLNAELTSANRQILLLEQDIDKRLETLEKGAVLVNKCSECKAGWSTQIEVYHKEGAREAQQIKELAALEMANIKQQLEFMGRGQDELRNSTRRMGDLLVKIMTTLASMGKRAHPDQDHEEP